MKSQRNFVVVLAILLSLPIGALADSKAEKAPKLGEEGRKSLIRGLQSETVFVRKPFPMGRVGIVIKEGTVTPSDPELRQLVADNGYAARLGERVRITNVIFKKNAIIFELNGGPVKKKKWYDRIQVSAGGGSTTPTNVNDKDPNNLYLNARGSYVTLSFKDYVPAITTDQVKELLNPVFDWKAMSVAEAYMKSLSPKLQAALKDHKALVGMDRELVTNAKGRPPRRHRERDAESGADYEEWIYGAPPEDVEFVRFQGDRVVRIVTMKVDGEKTVRTAKEVDLDSEVSTMAKKDEAAPVPTGKAPTLLRDGEKAADVAPSGSGQGTTRGQNTEPQRPGDAPNPNAPAGLPPISGPSGLPDASQGGPPPQ